MNDFTLGMSFNDMLSAVLKCDEHIAELFVNHYAEEFKRRNMEHFIINTSAPFFLVDIRYNFEIYSFVIKSTSKELTISKLNPPKKFGKRCTYTPLYTIPWKDL